MNYKMILAYDGTRYNGWQKQGNTDRTIQGKLEQILTRMAGGPIEVFGSGRTDRGVHAEGQTANFHLKQTEEYEDKSLQILEYINTYLPEDIAVLSCEAVPERFHSRLSAARKTYRYQIEMSPKKNVFQRDYYYGLGCRLDQKKMEEAAAFLIGTHDFKSFCGNSRMKKSTVRRIDSIEFEAAGESRLHIRYTGNGFLQQMVRILTGTLIEAGLGKREPEQMKAVLEALNRQVAGFTAPAQGLFLEKVEYGEGK